ncbi:MAG: TonB family protein [Candidatus Acidiferrales bacterium]
MVYAIPTTLVLRKNALVVSAGPIGGGGLGVYGALPCGKIYTIFLPMPVKNWTLQYCQQADPAARQVTDSRSPVVHLQQGLVPPDVQSRFDFRRLPVPEGKAGKMIVLKGTLREDGSIDDLRIYQGVVPEMDEAARIAFSRWKFKPAMREGKAVSVEILVGIPSEATSVQQTR